MATLSVEMIKAKKTAIHRSNIPAPTKYISFGRTLKGNILNFGCGRDDKTKSYLEQMFKGCTVDNYDPNFPDNSELPNKKYDIVIALYVVNVLPPRDRNYVVRQICKTIKENGTVYFAIRGHDSSIKGVPDYDGFRTERGTFQKPFVTKEIEPYFGRYFKEVKIIHGGRAEAMHIVECKGIK